MGITWSDDLAVGVAEIDEQHKELFARVDALLEACRQGRALAEVKSILLFLKEYVEVHFRAEEALQRQHHYPHARAHRLDHRRFALELRALSREIEVQGPGLSLLLTVNKTVVDWLLQHVAKSDRDFAQFLIGGVTRRVVAT